MLKKVVESQSSTVLQTVFLLTKCNTLVRLMVLINISMFSSSVFIKLQYRQNHFFMWSVEIKFMLPTGTYSSGHSSRQKNYAYKIFSSNIKKGNQPTTITMPNVYMYTSCVKSFFCIYFVLKFFFCSPSALRYF